MSQTNQTFTLEIKHELAIIIGLSLVLMLAVSVYPVAVVRTIIGLSFVAFFPGYVLLTALFPKRDNLSGITRAVLSFGLSLAVVPLIGLLLNYTQWGITLESTLASVTLLILMCSGVAYYRRSKLAKEERFTLRLEFDTLRWKSRGRPEKSLYVLLFISILGAVGAFAFAISGVGGGEQFTEFYMLNKDGLAENYPREATLGQPVEIVIGISSQEKVPTEYRVEIMSEGSQIGQTETVYLQPGEIKELPMSFTPTTAGDDIEVIFLLYRDGISAPYRSLRLWLEVTE